ncbi:CIC11C00000004671 [Sungouiella intermedia]|uniref:Ubiquitin carboxyl-terminal hydrolase n=1 Tax=Sungouiella intermedia TaxID=45354 RepID=A0A1L0DT54_9ASCO|nr:CIC11C00000004671 [[Candida] intermedia]
MVTDGELKSGLTSIQSLEVISKQIASNLVRESSRAADIIGYAITLLENFKFQVSKHQRLGYCDYEFAFVTFSISLRLVLQVQRTLDEVMLKFSDQLLEALEIQKENFESIRDQVSLLGGQSHISSEDSLQRRFESLRGNIEYNKLQHLDFELSDSISCERLNHIIRKSPEKVLLLDFRSKKEFNYSHINFLNVVNVEPLVLRQVLEANANPTDMDLEVALAKNVDSHQIQLFKERFKFESVFCYNLRFGGLCNDRFDSLEFSLLHGDNNGLPSQNPFRSLINLLIFDNKYISSRLKQYPAYLRGGLVKWFQVFGESALTSETSKFHSSDTSLNSSKTRETRSEVTNSSYVRNFSDYLSTARSSSAASPVESNRETKATSLNSYHKSMVFHDLSGNKLANKNSNGEIRSDSIPVASKVKVPSGEIQKSNPAQKVQTNKSTIFLELFTTGLTNLGNSCYMNCILQCLSSTPQLTSFFFPVVEENNTQVLQSYKQHINMKNKLGSKGVITTSFVKLLASMFNNSGKYFSPGSFKQTVGSLSPGRQFANSEQHDCIEFLNYILDSLHEDLNQRLIENAEERAAIMELSPEQEKAREFMPVRLASTIEWERYLKLNFSVIVDYFQGQYLSKLECLECHLTSTTYNAFSILSLPLPEKISGSYVKVTLDQCLDLFTETELLDDDNKWHCPRCQRFTKLTKKITITRFPKVLIIHLKRFNMDLRGYFKKLDTFVTYPVEDVLDLTRFWPSVGTYVNSDPRSIIPKERENEILASFPNRNQTPPFRYHLYGVVNHFGNLTTGHYTSYVKKKKHSGNGKQWCYFDDAKVQFDCSKDQVQNMNAYCLFYLRVQ